MDPLKALIAAQNRRFFDEAKPVVRLVAKWHDANPHCGGGPLPGSTEERMLLDPSWDDYASDDEKNGEIQIGMTYSQWSWSGPPTRQQPDDPESPSIHVDYHVTVMYHRGGDLEIECGGEDVTLEDGHDGFLNTIVKQRYPAEVWSREAFLADALAAAFDSPAAYRRVEKPSTRYDYIDWGVGDRENDPYGNPNW
jgi:hypothetical protein